MEGLRKFSPQDEDASVQGYERTLHSPLKTAMYGTREYSFCQGKKGQKGPLLQRSLLGSGPKACISDRKGNGNVVLTAAIPDSNRKKVTEAVK